MLESNLDVFGLKERIFLVKHFYQNYGNCLTVKQDFEIYYGSSQGQGIPTIESIVEVIELFEETGCVFRNAANPEAVFQVTELTDNVNMHKVIVDKQTDENEAGVEKIQDEIEFANVKIEPPEFDEMENDVHQDEIEDSHSEFLDIKKEEPIVMQKCSKCWGNYEEYTQHECLLLICCFCEEKFPKKALKKHMRKVHNISNRKTMCGICGKVLSSEKSRNVHEQTHSTEKPYVCSFEGCDKAFSFQYYLSRHQRIHKNEKKYKCEMCERTFRFSSTLYNHTWQYHNCTECDSKFIEHSDLLEHQRIHDAAPGNTLDRPPSKGKSRRCKTCGKLFATRSYLKTHMLTHSGVRLNKCSYCERSFRDKHVMKKHMKIHERPEKAFKCNVEDCISSFDKEPDLKRHIKRYHIEFLHRCTLCPKEYKTKSHVQVHIRRDHLKEDAPLKCSQCDYKSWFSHLFRAHLKHHHQIDITSMKNYRNALCPETDQEYETDNISINICENISCQDIGQDTQPVVNSEIDENLIIP